ncbi:hypothetical protein [Desulfovibrio sp. JC010]|uniref:hypothetical protein n=1 Tax=Desulfovibrio sp. JC010 TaxID=2593641 RepID=UPI0013D048B2|nr:hypothetical protein [Desulfovibrio sp. JC010]NDV26644.1 hypothetical protein [Desulfovibrio sp. JC010]
MKLARKLLTSLFICLLLCATASASQPGTPQELAKFKNFAIGWVVKLNKSHIKGFSRMEILPQKDGSYLARYHAISPDTISCKVKRTSAKSKGMVGLLKYIETIYESTGKNPQEARANKFKPVKNIRITEIFSNSGKGWR